MKKSYRIIICIMLAFILFSIPYSVNARSDIDIWGTAKDFLETGEEEVGALGNNGLLSKIFNLKDKTKYKFEELIDFLWGIGLLVIFITTIVLGIRYMFVSPQEKSKIKQIVIPYIIGVVVIFGALTIWKFVIVILDGSLSSI